jgi:hypothetical protein
VDEILSDVQAAGAQLDRLTSAIRSKTGRTSASEIIICESLDEPARHHGYQLNEAHPRAETRARCYYASELHARARPRRIHSYWRSSSLRRLLVGTLLPSMSAA